MYAVMIDMHYDEVFLSLLSNVNTQHLRLVAEVRVKCHFSSDSCSLIKLN